MSIAIHIDSSEPRPDALADRCPEHPGAGSSGGFGLAGGGFGSYQVCDECGRVFGKIVLPDGDEF